MEISFWYLALAGGLLTWTTCTFLRAVATRAKQLREQAMEQLGAVNAPEPHEAEEVEEIGGDGGVAMVMNVPNKNKPTSKPPTNGKSSRASNGKSNGHAVNGGGRRMQ